MKKFKFFKILYYGLVILAGLIMCVLLPNYNEYNLISNEMRTVLENKEFDKLPGFFYSKYYNGECLYNETIKDNSDKEHEIFVFETILYHDYDEANRLSYAKEAYMVFIIGGSTFDYSTIKDDYGNDINKAKLLLNGKELDKDDETFYKVNDNGIDLLYFDISKYEIERMGMNSFNSISLLNNKEEKYMDINLGKDFDYKSSFFDKAQGYFSIYNSICTNFEAVLNGTFTLDDNCTKMTSGSKITINPYGYVKVFVDAEGSFEVTGATKVEETKKQDGTIDVPAHYVVSELSVEFKATTDVLLKSIIVNFDDIDVKFSFDGSNEGYYLSENVTSEKEVKLGKAYDSETLLKELEEWEKDYNFVISTVGSTITNKRIMTKTVIQIVIYFVVALIIGDFIVGKHYIIYFFQKIFAKKKSNNVDEEETVINNEYNVNVEITAYVPVGYEEDVYVRYVKDEQHQINVTLKHSTGYKHVERLQNGTYKLEELRAPGLHQMKPVRELKVRGFKFKVDLLLANDEGVTPTVTKNEE